MPDVSPPRHGSPSPLLRLALPWVVFGPVAVAGLGATHPALALKCTLIPAAIATPAMLLARRWWETATMLFVVVVAAGFVGAVACAMGT